MSDSMRKTIPPEFGRCDIHQCNLTDGLSDNVERQSNWDLEIYCEQCRSKEQEAVRVHELKLALERKADQYQIHQRNAGVPPRFIRASLDTFITDTVPQQEILAVLKQFNKTHGKDPSGLLLVGRLGTGKTFAGYALINAWLQTHHDALFVTALGLVRKVRDTWHSTETRESKVIRLLATVGLLVIDEVGIQSCSANEHMIIADILNQRYENLKPTVVIGNLTVAELTTILGERAIDRFHEGGRVLSFTWESRRKNIT